ncbi:MAG: hypothetical protein WBX03_13585, partial [Terriglobales bacterium]
DSLMNIAMKYRDRIDSSMMMPQVNWRQARNDRQLQVATAAPAPKSHLQVVGAGTEKGNGHRTAKTAKRAAGYSKR